MTDAKANKINGPLDIQWELGEAARSSTNDLPQPLTYLALSYTWGEPGETTVIEINGERVPVAKNLEAALRALRNKQLLRQGCAIWVDALCINQGDVAERSEEVGRMRDIYKSASAVAMWLGEEAIDSAKAIALIKALASAFRSGGAEQLADSIRDGNSPIHPGSWAAFARLMERPYWTRVWILQEVAMGNRSTPIMCGELTVTWGELFDAMYRFASVSVDLFFSCIDREYTGNRGLRRNHIIQLNKIQMKQEDVELLPILDVARRCSVTNAKDRVYGVLGMMPDEISKRVILDYSKSRDEIYKSFAKAMILARQNLLILEECTWPPAPGSPSWVPDWTRGENIRLFSGKQTYSAASGMLPDIGFDASSEVLTCSGVRLGVVDGLGATCYDGDHSQLSSDTIHQTRNTHQAYTSEQELETAIWQTLVGNRIPTGEIAPKEYECLLQCALKDRTDTPGAATTWRGRTTFDRLMMLNRDLRIGGMCLGTLFPQAKEHDESDPGRARDALERMFRFWRSRRLLVTTEGELGAGPAAMQPGDEVFVLCGSNVPVVLRRCDKGGYQVVGCCYMQRYMDGEVSHGIQQGTRDLHKVHIR